MRRYSHRFSEEGLYQALLRFMNKQAQLAAGHVIRTQIGEGKAINYRSGQLAQGVVGARNVVVEGIPAARIGVFKGPALRYAGIQEFGTAARNPDSPFGPILPRTAKAMAFAPLGSPANPELRGHRMYDSPRQFPQPLQFLPIRKGPVIGRLVLKEELHRVRLGMLDFSAVQTIFLLMSKVELCDTQFLWKGFVDFLPTMAQNVSNFITSTLID